jgi:TRAP-type mannitol/chloroaromatic compound transport system substrate-binding protein
MLSRQIVRTERPAELVSRAKDLRTATSTGEWVVLLLPLPVSVLRDLKKLSADVVREESEKTHMARKVHASYTKFQALVGPWDHVAEGAYHQLVAV